jgi:hypothetical protein
VFLPFAIYSPETEAAAVLTGLYHFRPGDPQSDVPPSNVMLSLSYSQNDQKSVQFFPELYLKNETAPSAEQ